jgi:triosephosphate isomerase
MRSKIVAGNWKMNKTLDEAIVLTKEISSLVTHEVEGDAKIIFCVPFPFLQVVKNELTNSTNISVGAQNCSEHEAGAYTGEVSAAMLNSLAIPYVILGHSGWVSTCRPKTCRTDR